MILDWKRIEEKWQRRWVEAKIFEINPIIGKKKFFVTVAYPYPNSPQHIGHGRTYTLCDVYARFKRMQGYNVLFPMAFHYTGTPVLAISKRIASGEKGLIDDFIKIYKVPPEIVKTFVAPLEIANYFRNEIKAGMKEIGYSIDWRREFTTIDLAYNRFIEWQFKKLKAKGLITRGDHPVGWCQRCGNPMGQHDTKGDVEPEIGEMILIKFKYGDTYLPTGTLRPETIFGVTNIWVRPDIEYVTIDVNGETWIVSNECVSKLALINHKLSITGKVKGKNLVGKYVDNPITKKKIPILPALFVDPKNATGLVMSVPGHAPLDYVALEDLKKNRQTLSNFCLNPEVVEEIKPISLISLEGYSEFPAMDINFRLGIRDQMDPRIEEATKTLYSQEYHNGRMKENTLEYAGMNVSGARDKIQADLLRTGKIDTMYELLNRPVYCRCGSEVVVKIFKDQWFINYEDAKWKALANECLEAMKIIPEELRVEFRNVISWLKEKACARKQGLGTRLPWDSEWIIESLSDSVIYMSYYTISRHIKDHTLNADKLDDQVFDYVFLGIGDPNTIGGEKGINPSKLLEIRNEFNYFYPLDSRNSGRDLVPNHLTYFIFNHVAIFPKKLWPKQIIVNGSVLMEGKKMSKSIGNIIPLRDALIKYGADPCRMAVLATAELIQDADFSSILAKTLGDRLERFYSFALQNGDVKEIVKDKALTTIDLWLLNQSQNRVKIITEAMENTRFREAIHNALYMFDQDVQWYLKRNLSDNGEQKSSQILKQVMETRTLLLAPFAPHLCEEIWEKLGKPSFISTFEWPSYDEAKLDVKILIGEELIKILRDDVLNIIKAIRTTPKKILFYIASGWKWKIYLKTLELSVKGQIKVGDLMNDLMSDKEFQRHGKKVPVFVQKIVRDINKMSADLIKKRIGIGKIDEKTIVEEAKTFYEREFNAEIIVYEEGDVAIHDPADRTRFAAPYRPAIYIE